MASTIPQRTVGSRLRPQLSPSSCLATVRLTASRQTRPFTISIPYRASITASPKTKPRIPPNPSSRINRPPRSKPAAQQAQPLNTLFATYRFHLLGAGLFTGLAAFYIAATITATLKEDKQQPKHGSTPGVPCGCAPPTGRPGAMETASSPEQRRIAAEQFDKELRFPEWLSGITKKRGQLAALAVGDVLEVAVGTGRNFPYYDWSGLLADSSEGETTRSWFGGSGGKEPMLRSFTGVDISPDMLGVARDRLREAVPGLVTVMRRKRAEPMPEGEGVVVDMLDGKVRLMMGDAEKGLPSSPSGEKYDTVVQTFGLCSVIEPVKLLASAASAVKPDTGRIILLEHGRGWKWFGWLNSMLDRSAGKHFEKYGCWWNRDIEQLVRDAEKEIPGLQLVNVARPWSQAGTMFYIELKLNSKSSGSETRKR